MQGAPSGRVRRAPYSAAGCGEAGPNLGHEVLVLVAALVVVDRTAPFFDQVQGFRARPAQSREARQELGSVLAGLTQLRFVRTWCMDATVLSEDLLDDGIARLLATGAAAEVDWPD